MNFNEVWSGTTWRTLLDVTLVAALFYQVISMLKGTRAAQVLVGLLVIFLAYVVSSLLELETINWMISKFYSSFIFVVIILFQDDIRRLLTRFGRGPFVGSIDELSGKTVIDEVISAAKNLSHDRTGALIVFERGIGLERLYDHAVKMDALVSEQLLTSIFQSFSPLHDGAVIVQKNRLSCASAQLPLSKNPLFSRRLGTRHSAAVGISEETDAVVLVVSEETGGISLAVNGQLLRGLTGEVAQKMLLAQLIPNLVSGRKNWIAHSVQAVFDFVGQRLQNKVKADVESQFYTSKKSKESSAPDSAEHSFEKGTKSAIERYEMQFKSGLSQNSFSQSNVTAPPSEIQSAAIHHGDSDWHEAAVSLTHMPQEHKFVPPPVPPPPPPRDVSIAGVSLNPPKDTTEEDFKKAFKESSASVKDSEVKKP
jgi:diadenylate cyclase